MNFAQDEYIVAQIYPQGMKEANSVIQKAVASQHLWTRLVYREPIHYLVLARNESFTHKGDKEVLEMVDRLVADGR